MDAARRRAGRSRPRLYRRPTCTSLTPASRKAAASCSSSQTDCGFSRRFFGIAPGQGAAAAGTGKRSEESGELLLCRGTPRLGGDACLGGAWAGEAERVGQIVGANKRLLQLLVARQLASRRQLAPPARGGWPSCPCSFSGRRACTCTARSCVRCGRRPRMHRVGAGHLSDCSFTSWGGRLRCSGARRRRAARAGAQWLRACARSARGLRCKVQPQ